jgi:hypothetical protein
LLFSLLFRIEFHLLYNSGESIGGPLGEGANGLPLHISSHAQLSLIGWGSNGLWEQAGQGSNGESITFEPNGQQRCVNHLDTRPFAACAINENVGGACNSNTFKNLGWTENVGGSDMLKIWTPSGAQLDPFATESHSIFNGRLEHIISPNYFFSY